MLKIRHLKSYCREARKMRHLDPQSCGLGELIELFPAWRRSLQPGATPLGDKVPWITFAACKFLEPRIVPGMRVHEYGAGGSTLFFATRGCEVSSVEHDEAWANRVRETLARENLTNVQLRCLPPEPVTDSLKRDPTEPDDYFSSDENFQQHTFRNYATAIDAFADGYFHLVVIDGRARPSCYKHALAKVAPGGWLMLDNSDRDSYRRIHQDMAAKGWKKWGFSGPGPYVANFWQTCYWQKPQ